MTPGGLVLNLTVLAGSYLEGRRFLAAHGLRGSVVFSGQSALGRRFDVVLELPGYANNRSRFGVEGLLRGQATRFPVVRMLIPADQVPTRAIAGEAPGRDEMSGQTTIEQQIRIAEDAQEVAPAAEPATPKPAVPAKPKYQARSKRKAS